MTRMNIQVKVPQYTAISRKVVGDQNLQFLPLGETTSIYVIFKRFT